MSDTSPNGDTDLAHRPIVIRLGREELIIRQRYETISIINDILIGIWFLVGSFLFFSSATTRIGTWLFVIGSFEMLIRPFIRLARRVHLQRLRNDTPLPTTETSLDF